MSHTIRPTYFSRSLLFPTVCPLSVNYPFSINPNLKLYPSNQRYLAALLRSSPPHWPFCYRRVSPHICCLLPTDCILRYCFCALRVCMPSSSPYPYIHSTSPCISVSIILWPTFPYLFATIAVTQSQITLIYDSESPLFTAFPYWQYQNECSRQS